MSQKWICNPFLRHCLENAQTFLKTQSLRLNKLLAMPSTVIEQFSYDQATSRLKITFRSGNVYVYKNVPQKIYDELKMAGSKGGYFNRSIKYSYEFEHLLRD